MEVYVYMNVYITILSMSISIDSSLGTRSDLREVGILNGLATSINRLRVLNDKTSGQ